MTSKIENWFISQIMYESKNPSFPNLILGILGIYYLIKWSIDG